MIAVSRVVVVALCIAAAPLAGQDKCGPDEVVPWWPRFINGTEFTTAERAIMDANLQAAEDIMRKTNYGRPRGFAVTPAWGYQGRNRGERSWGRGNPTRNPIRPYGFSAIVH